jgi:acetolactate synthase small subunit
MIKIAGTVVLVLAGITLIMLLYNSSKDNEQLNNQLNELNQKVKVLESTQQNLFRENIKLQSIISFQQYRNSAPSQMQLQAAPGTILSCHHIFPMSWKR